MKRILLFAISILFVILIIACNLPSPAVATPVQNTDPVYLTAISCVDYWEGKGYFPSAIPPKPPLNDIATVYPWCDPSSPYLTAVACAYGNNAFQNSQSPYTSGTNPPYSWGDIYGDSDGRCIPTPTPTQAIHAILTPVASGNRCALFNDLQFTLVTLNWQAGQPLEFYIKMPGGVPGLEKQISQDSGPWNYSVNWGNLQAQDCKFMPGLPERLYCSINFPSQYANTSKILELHVNGCDSPIYQNFHADIPAIVGLSSGSTPQPPSTPHLCPAGKTYQCSPGIGIAGPLCSCK